MILFKCTLINNGYVQELFYRKADSKAELLELLEMFIWSDGSWEINEVTA